MRLRVTPEMTARFFDCTIHPVYATFAIVEHGEYAARQAIIGFLEPEEDAVGTRLELEHVATAAVGEIVKITACVAEVDGRTITCSITAHGERGIIAHGTQAQRVVSKLKLRERIAGLYGTESTQHGNQEEPR